MATHLAMLIAATSFVVSRLDQGRSLVLLLAGGVLLDFGVQANLVLGQREIYSIGSHLRSRLNGLYMAIFFCGGAVCSSVPMRSDRRCKALRASRNRSTLLRLLHVFRESVRMVFVPARQRRAIFDQVLRGPANTLAIHLRCDIVVGTDDVELLRGYSL